MVNTTNIKAENILFVDRWSSRCGACFANVPDINERNCPTCRTAFSACVAEFMVGDGREKQLCEDATEGLPCIGIGSAISGEYSPFSA